MDGKTLGVLGKAVGIGGVALGVMGFIFKDILVNPAFLGLPPDKAYRLWVLIIAGLLVLSALGIFISALGKSKRPKTPKVYASQGGVAMGDKAKNNKIVVKN